MRHGMFQDGSCRNLERRLHVLGMPFINYNYSVKERC